MNCARCGAGVISGSERCYRCQQPINASPAFDDAQPFSITPPAPSAQRPAPHSPRPAPRAALIPARQWPVRAAAAAAFSLAVLGLVDLARGDSAAVLLLVALQVLAGTALLTKWRFAWGGGVTLASLGCALAFLAFLGGGGVSALLVAGLSLTGVVSLSQHGTRASLRSRTRARVPSTSVT